MPIPGDVDRYDALGVDVAMCVGSDVAELMVGKLFRLAPPNLVDFGRIPGHHDVGEQS
jgi:hypothetical protein